MSKKLSEPPVPLANDPDLLAHYDFSGAVRGKYADRFRDGYVIRVEKAGVVEETRLVRLPPDVAAAFPSDAAVHAALREWLQARQDAASQAELPILS